MFKFPAKMAGLKTPTMALAMVLVSMAFSGNMATAVQHHVVGDDKGWDVTSDIGSWAFGRVFKVGDNIWFDNTASRESLVELENVDEFSSCDLTNPIKMFTEDITKVSLDGEGSRYFVSGDPMSCKKGLKLHINVLPRKEDDTHGEGGSFSEYKDVIPKENDDTGPHGRVIPDVPEPPPSPKPKPPHKAPPPEFDPDSPPEPFDPDVGPDAPPEPYYPPPIFPPPTPSSSTLLNGYFMAMVAAACWVAI